MASWSGLLAMTGFHYSEITKEITFGNIFGNYFWSNGYAYGTVEISKKEGSREIKLTVLNGNLILSGISIEVIGTAMLKESETLNSGESVNLEIKM